MHTLILYTFTHTYIHTYIHTYYPDLATAREHGLPGELFPELRLGDRGPGRLAGRQPVLAERPPI